MTATPFLLEHYREVRQVIIERGHADDIAWAEGITPPKDAADMACELIFVICNSGMQHRVARRIYERVVGTLAESLPVSGAFGHKGKVAAIEHIWANAYRLYDDLLLAQTADGPEGYEQQLAWALSLPWIGKITGWHVIKNFGADVAKPDVWMQRLSAATGEEPQALCRRLSHESGDRVATVDTVLWRAMANGWLRPDIINGGYGFDAPSVTARAET